MKSIALELGERDVTVIRFFIILWKIDNFWNCLLDYSESKPISWESFSLEVLLMAPVITRAALY